MGLMRKLAVGASSKQRRRSPEHRFEQRVAKCLAELGIWNYHACPDWSPGIPDRYLAGGRWIEFKSVAYRDSITWRRRVVSHDQCRKLDELMNGGDKPYVCLLLHHDKDEHPRLLFERWSVFRDRKQLLRDEVIERYLPIANDDELKMRLVAVLNEPY